MKRPPNGPLLGRFYVGPGSSLAILRRAALWAVVCVLGAGFAGAGCKKRAFHEAPPSARFAASGNGAQSEAATFCARSEAQGADDPAAFAAQRDEPGHIWTAREIQFHIRTLLADPAFAGKAASAYLVAYQDMLEQRDRERCLEGSPMRTAGEPEDRALNEALNTVLADVMTRSLLNISRYCVSVMADPPPTSLPGKTFEAGADLFVVDVGGLWCTLFREAHAKKRDAVTFAMANTALYLTVNLGFALSALPHIDAAWPTDEYTTLAERVKRLERYKPTFDAFNHFLSKHTDTVAGSLAKANLLRQKKLFTFAADFVELVPVVDDTLGIVRTSAFDIGMSVAEKTPFRKHPLAEPVSNGKGQAERTVVRTHISSDVNRQLSTEERAELEAPLRELIALGRHIAHVFSRHTFRIFGGVKFGG